MNFNVRHYAAEEDLSQGLSEGLVVEGDNVAEASDRHPQRRRNVEAGQRQQYVAVATA